MIKNQLYFVKHAPQNALYDDVPAGGDTPKRQEGGDPKNNQVSLDTLPEDVRKFVDSEIEKNKKVAEAALQELDAVKTKAEMTTKERDEMDKRMNDMRTQLMTKEELAKQDLEKTHKDYTKKLEAVTLERDGWKQRYESETITRALLDAASKEGQKASNPSQIVALLRGSTFIESELDKEGKPTGNLIPKVRFNETVKGEQVTLILTVDEAVKKMSEQKEHYNLFITGDRGGLGNSGGITKNIDLKELAKDPVAFREAVKSGAIKI